MKSYVSFLAVSILLMLGSMGVLAQDDNLATILEDSEDFGILKEALEASDLLEVFEDDDAEFTVFAPTDEAFEAVLEELDIELDVLLEDPEALSAILLYHVVDGTILSEDFEDGSELETLNGASIAVAVNEDGEINLNDAANLSEVDIEASNGVIHVIDAVLLPPDEASTDVETCIVFAETERTAAIRVGPGENRTSIAFLPANTEFEVLGQATDDEGNVWFKLDKDQATPNRSNAEAWVAAADVETSGDCESVIDVNAPPVIPIINQVPPTAVPSSSGGGDSAGGDDSASGDTGQVDTTGQITLSTGTWNRTVSSTFDASCTGYGNVNLPTNEYFIIFSNTFTLSRNGTGFTMGDLNFTFIGDNTYQAVGSLGGGETGTWYLRATSANRLEGRYIWSFSANGTSCSATLYLTYTH